MRHQAASLDQKLPKGCLRSALDWLVPAIATYDAASEAKKLVQDMEISTAGLTEQELIPHLVQAQKENKWLYIGGMIGDTVDRYTGVIAATAEAGVLFAANLVGVPVAGATHIIHQTIDLGGKATFFYQYWKDPYTRQEAKRLLIHEVILSYTLPFIRTAHEVFTNVYLSRSKSTIRMYAKNAALECKASDQRRLSPPE
jgi:hypothetical protein